MIKVECICSTRNSGIVEHLVKALLVVWIYVKFINNLDVIEMAESGFNMDEFGLLYDDYLVISLI